MISEADCSCGCKMSRSRLIPGSHRKVRSLGTHSIAIPHSKTCFCVLCAYNFKRLHYLSGNMVRLAFDLSVCHSSHDIISVSTYVCLKLNSVSCVRERTIPAERPPLVGEVSANFVDKGCHVVSLTDPYGRIHRFWTGPATFSSK
jgi:hypothetical protein